MQTSVGKALRALYKDGNKSAYFLLGDDYFLQNIFISKLMEKTEEVTISKSLIFGQKSVLNKKKSLKNKN